MEALVFIFWIVASLAVGVAGGERKIGFFSAFLLSVILSPLMGILFVIASKSKADADFERLLLSALQNLQNADSESPDVE